jgi:uncharacterized phage infection (PIP) family protein YhgE
VNEIAAASQEQSSGIDQVNNAITNMDEVTQQNAALVEQAAAAASSLENKAHELIDSTSKFKLAETLDQRTINSKNLDAINMPSMHTLAKDKQFHLRAPKPEASSSWEEF